MSVGHLGGHRDFRTRHIDDAYYCGDADFHRMIMKPLFDKFKMGQIMEGDFRSLGWNVRKNYRGEIAISQKDYITDKVEKLSIQKPRHALLQTRLSEKEASILGSSIRCLRWLEDQTHPDCAIACLVLNTKQLTHVRPPGY